MHKAFGGVQAVSDVNLALDAGEVVAVLGHNGAGKSTLMKMLAGAYPIDRGEIRIARRARAHRQPGRLAGAGHRDHPPDAGAGRQPRRRRQPVPRPRADDALEHDGRLRDGGRGARRVRAAEPELPQHPRAGALAVRRPAPGRRDLARAVLQGPRPGHGRALRRARARGDAHGARPRAAAEGARRRRVPDLARHARRVRAVRPPGRDEERPRHRHLPHRRPHRGRGAGHDHRRQARHARRAAASRCRPARPRA